jgi:predicted PurR-regulated permease PerM
VLSVLWVTNAWPSVGWPLLLAGASAYLLDPLVTRLARLGLSRTTAAVLLYVGLLFVAGLALLLLVPMLVTQLMRLPAYVAHLVEEASPWFEAHLGHALPSDARTVADLTGTSLGQLVARALPTAGSFIGTLVGGSLSALAFLGGALVVPVVGFTLLQYWPQLGAFARSLVPPDHRDVFGERTRALDRMLSGFIRGQLTMAAVLSVLYSGALSLVGVKLAVVVGLVTGIGNLVPYLGTVIGLTLAIVSCLVDFGPDVHSVLVVGAFGAIATADSLVLTPRIVGDRVGLPPAAVIVAVLVAGTLFGFAGVLLAVPLAAFFKLAGGVLAEAWRQSYGPSEQ